jgi:hypothetical protein
MDGWIHCSFACEVDGDRTTVMFIIIMAACTIIAAYGLVL